MDDLRQECSVLRRKNSHLEAERTELATQVKEWRAWYVRTYRPQIEYLNSEVSRLCAFAPQIGSPSAGASLAASGAAYSTGFSTASNAPAVTAPPGMRRGAGGRASQSGSSLINSGSR